MSSKESERAGEKERESEEARHLEMGNQSRRELNFFIETERL